MTNVSIYKIFSNSMLIQGLVNVYILAYALVNASNNFSLCMCTDAFVFEWVSSYFFPLRNATFAIFAKDVPVIPIKHI